MKNSQVTAPFAVRIFLLIRKGAGVKAEHGVFRIGMIILLIIRDRDAACICLYVKSF